MARNAVCYTRKSIMTFVDDVPDNDYQRGYLSALFDVWDYATDGEREPDPDVERLMDKVFPNRIRATRRAG